MPIDMSYNVNSALISGQLGLQRASDGITQSSLNIAQRIAQRDVAENGPAGVLVSAAEQQITNFRNTLPKRDDSFTSDLLSLQINSLNALASAKVVGTADETVGRIIDLFA